MNVSIGILIILLVFWSGGGNDYFFNWYFETIVFFQLVFWNDYFFQLVFWKGIVGILISFIGILFTQWYFVHWYFNQVLSICSDPLFPTKRRTPKIPKSPPSTRRLYWSRKNTEQIFIFLAISCQDEAGMRTPRPYPLLVFAGDITLRPGAPYFEQKIGWRLEPSCFHTFEAGLDLTFPFFTSPLLTKYRFFLKMSQSEIFLKHCQRHNGPRVLTPYLE